MPTLKIVKLSKKGLSELGAEWGQYAFPWINVPKQEQKICTKRPHYRRLYFSPTGKKWAKIPQYCRNAYSRRYSTDKAGYDFHSKKQDAIDEALSDLESGQYDRGHYTDYDAFFQDHMSTLRKFYKGRTDSDIQSIILKKANSKKVDIQNTKKADQELKDYVENCREDYESRTKKSSKIQDWNIDDYTDAIERDIMKQAAEAVNLKDIPF